MNIAEGVAATFPAAAGGPLAGARALTSTAATRTIGSTAATAARPIGRTTAATAWAISSAAAASARTIAGAATIAKIGLPTARLENLITAAAAEVHAILAPTTGIVVAKLLLDARVVVFHALPMLRVVLPVTAGIDVVDVGVAIDVDVVVAPIHTAAPIASGCPAADGDASAERYSCRQDRAGDYPYGGGK